MKKKLLLIPVLLITLLVSATPVFAVDPPDTEVDIVVVTPGDIDLDVDINAGGAVDITVGGIDLAHTASLARQAYIDANRPVDGEFDFRYYYWRVTDIGRSVVDQFNQIWETINLLIASQARMIQELEIANARIDELEKRVEALE